jgi:hypothetical protein
LASAVEKYNELVEEVAEWVQGVASDRRDEFDNRSEGWQVGDNGQAADQWISEWEGFEGEQVEMPGSTASEDLENLPDQV